MATATRSPITSLSTKPDFERAMDRIEAWYHGAVLDRPPVRFTAHNADFEKAPSLVDRSWPDLKSRWFDAEFQVDYFVESIRGNEFLAETFPVFWPNLGPDVFAAFYGCDLVFGDVTSWSVPLVESWDDVSRVRLDLDCVWMRKLEELTRVALDRREDRYLVGYTDLHPGMDCVGAWRDPQQLCVDLIESPDEVQNLITLATADFQSIYDRYHEVLVAHGLPSVTWMAIPSWGKMHIPSCDFAALISTRHFEEFGFPILEREVRTMDRNIFHMDGKGVARHADLVLSVPQVHAVQWVQGMGDDVPILQWAPLLRRIRAAGKSLVIDLQVDELEGLIEAMPREGLFLCIAAEPEVQPDVLRRVERW